MKTCNKCRTSYDDDATYCNICDVDLVESNVQVSQVIKHYDKITIHSAQISFTVFVFLLVVLVVPELASKAGTDILIENTQILIIVALLFLVIALYLLDYRYIKEAEIKDIRVWDKSFWKASLNSVFFLWFSLAIWKNLTRAYYVMETWVIVAILMAIVLFIIVYLTLCIVRLLVKWQIHRRGQKVS